MFSLIIDKYCLKLEDFDEFQAEKQKLSLLAGKQIFVDFTRIQ